MVFHADSGESRAGQGAAEEPTPRGVRVITAYKLVKGIGEAAGAGLLATWIALGYGPSLHRFAEHVRGHVAGAWSVRLGDALVALATPHRLWALVVALLFDGAMTMLEGVSLARRWWWGPWLVVVATSALLPFEIVTLARHVHVGRLLLLIANVAIVAYLARRVWSERRRRE